MQSHRISDLALHCLIPQASRVILSFAAKKRPSMGGGSPTRRLQDNFLIDKRGHFNPNPQLAIIASNKDITHTTGIPSERKMVAIIIRYRLCLTCTKILGHLPHRHPAECHRGTHRRTRCCPSQDRPDQHHRHHRHQSLYRL